MSYTVCSLLDPDCCASRLIASGMSAHEAPVKGKLFARAAQSLIERGTSPDAEAVAVFAPGRIEVLGKHTDYCGGRSIICTVERGMCFVAVARRGLRIRFTAIDVNDLVEMELAADLEPAKRHWSNYPMTVARRIARNFPGELMGADIAMTSDLPSASGLSSSSAMIVGCFLVLSRINELEKSHRYVENIATHEDLAGYISCIENGQSFRQLAGDVGVGTFGGSQDHTAILCCKPGKLSVYSFCPVKREREFELPAELRFVVVGSGVVAEKTGDALEKYNAVSQRARTLVEIWNRADSRQATCLRDVVELGPGAVGRLGALASDTKLIGRLAQFICESQEIIPGAVKAFESHDWSALKELVNSSQAGAESGLGNQVPETINLQRRIVGCGAIAASAFGAGFGGSVWGLYQDEVLRGEGEEILAGPASVFVTRPGCPAMEI